ncbi:hypothetical protein [Rhizobium rhizogenes]|uniref:hypothetical protein n=1 Tax=Rhizobium rhizogenes TaxID=359 RepID=UPI0024BE02DC|nr:hypothetical protein [Rhizobium rhizogenes]MDJ1634566.1 hypothetical protein [Rhizobium rhizogenes]
MDIISSLAIAGQALDIVKKLRELDGDLKQAEVKLQLADLYGKLAEVKITLAEARTELSEKDGEIAALKQRSSEKLKTIRIGSYNFGIGADGKPFTKAFCTACEQTLGLQIPVSNSLAGRDACPKCKGIYDSRATTVPANFQMPQT